MLAKQSMEYNKWFASDYTITCNKPHSTLKGLPSDTNVYSKAVTKLKGKIPQRHSSSAIGNFSLKIRVYRYIRGQLSRETASLCSLGNDSISYAVCKNKSKT